jgi:hypothetical protein
VNSDPALIVKYTNIATVMTIGVSSRWTRNTRRTLRPSDGLPDPVGEVFFCCPGGLDSGAAEDVGASDCTLAGGYTEIDDGGANAFTVAEVPSNRLGTR